MKKRLLALSIAVPLALAVTAILPHAQAGPQGRPNAIEAVEVWDPFAIFHPAPVGTVEQMGVGTCTQGQELGVGDRMTPDCTDNGRFIKRGFVFSAPVWSEDAQLSGSVTVTVNHNHDSAGNGPGWGTWIEYVAGGTFEGIFSSTRSLLPNDGNLPTACSEDLPPGWDPWPCWVERVQLAGEGTGSVQGRQIQLTIMFYSRFLQGYEAHAKARAWIVPER